MLHPSNHLHHDSLEHDLLEFVLLCLFHYQCSCFHDSYTEFVVVMKIDRSEIDALVLTGTTRKIYLSTLKGRGDTLWIDIRISTENSLPSKNSIGAQ